jgi:hypothetical protein
MSRISLSGNASGTGTLTLSAPNTDTDRTLTLPDNTGTILTNATAGTVLQVVSSTANSTVSTTSTSYVTTNLSATITPTSATSKIFAIWTNTVATGGASTGIYVTLYRGATDLGATDFTGIVTSGNNYGLSFSYLDSPATTSSTTYTVYFKRTGVNTTVYANITGFISSLTLMEIAA